MINAPKTLALFLLAVTLLGTCGCQGEIREISCEEIVKAYEDAGYSVSHGAHGSAEEDSFVCYIKAEVPEDPDNDYIYFTTYFTEEAAKDAAEAHKYNPAVWLFALPFGEWRWLKSKSYGKIAYTYYDADLAEPFEKLTK